jgi:hypothetical protein
VKTIRISKAKMSEITAVRLGKRIVFTDGERHVTLYRNSALDPNEDSPELEEELLKGFNGPLSRYSPGAMRDIGKRI